ncbi:MAG: hypothetical protein IK137_02760 [Bacilli bacterium]|nr:hypothetical protein [Bacilli bacterium]
MEKKQFENNNFVLYAPDSLKHVFKNLEKVLYETLEVYKDLFNVDDFRKISIYYFDDIDKFRDYVYELRGEKDSLPQYANGVFAEDKIIAYINPNIKESDPLFNKRVHMASHELFHIMYRELVINKNHQERFTWFDEGCAQFFSGEKNYELNDGFSEWFSKIKSETKEIPDLNNLTHGDAFKNDNYNGYDLSLLAVKNLYERLGPIGFKRIFVDSNRIYNYGLDVLEQAFLFYSVQMGIIRK